MTSYNYDFVVGRNGDGEREKSGKERRTLRELFFWLYGDDCLGLFVHFKNNFIFYIFKINLFIYLFLAVLGLRCGARTSQCGGFSCCRARALGARASVVVAHGLQ